MLSKLRTTYFGTKFGPFFSSVHILYVKGDLRMTLSGIYLNNGFFLQQFIYLSILDDHDRIYQRYFTTLFSSSLRNRTSHLYYMNNVLYNDYTPPNLCTRIQMVIKTTYLSREAPGLKGPLMSTCRRPLAGLCSPLSTALCIKTIFRLLELADAAPCNKAV